MAQEQAVDIPVHQMKVGETWQSGTGNAWTVINVRAASALMRRKADDNLGDLAFADMNRWSWKRVAEAPPPPLAHNFSDRYSASSRGLHCVACGVVQEINDGNPCKPDHTWRVVFEEWLRQQSAISAANGFDIDYELYLEKVRTQERSRPRQQSHPLLAGGVFSLRDET